VRVAMKDLLGDGTVAVCGMLRVMSCVRFIVLSHTRIVFLHIGFIIFRSCGASVLLYLVLGLQG
jgi:hypothetical protein